MLAEDRWLDFDSRTRSVYIGLRRTLDIVSSVVALTVFGLVLPLIAVAIKLDSRGSVFYSQTRVGINRRRRGDESYEGQNRRKIVQPGKPFNIYKLRTMRVDAEQNGPQWASKRDKRVTAVGRLLRETHLDELPQFWNVLRGEMSLIGPRPERLCFINQFEKDIPEYRDRLLMLPGITGLAQVMNGYDDGFDSVRRKVKLDRFYIQKAGFALDAKIILSTVKVVVKREGAH